MISEEYKAVVTCSHGIWPLKSEEYCLPCECIYDEIPQTVNYEWAISASAAQEDDSDA